MDRFSKDLNRILRKRLPQSNEYFPSNRIEENAKNMEAELEKAKIEWMIKER